MHLLPQACSTHMLPYILKGKEKCLLCSLIFFLLCLPSFPYRLGRLPLSLEQWAVAHILAVGI